MGLRSFWNGRSQNYLVSLLDNPSNKYNQINSLSQKTDVTDMINAAYVTYGSKFSGIAYQVGLRFEQSKLVGKSLLENQQSFGYDYPKKASELFNALFPSVYLSKKLNKMGNAPVRFK